MPPRRGRTPNNNPDFLWVNRTPDSDRLSASRQEREELRTITSHARTWRAALRRQQRLAAAQNGASHAQRIVGWNRPDSAAQSERSSSETSAAPSPAPLVPFPSDDVAPFAYLEDPGDAWWSQNAFQYATQSWLPLIFQNLDAFNAGGLMAQSKVSDTINAIIQGCLHNRMHMFSLLSASTGYLKFVLKAQLDKIDTPEYCTGKALQYLRYYFSSDPNTIIDELVIFDLMALSAFERYVGNPEGARTHFGMVQHLVESHGGLESIDLPLRSVCREWDILVAAGTGERPLMPVTWDPGDLPSSRLHEVQHKLLQLRANPGGSSLYEYATLTPSALSEILISVVQWFQLQQLLHLRPPDQEVQQRSWATRRSYALVHQLLSTPVAATFPSSSGVIVGRVGEDRLLECIKQACLITISSIEEARSVRIGHPQQSQSGQSFTFYNMPLLRQALTAFLQQQGSTVTVQRQELILWITCMAAQKSTQQQQQHSEAEDADEEDHRDWFLTLAGQIARCMHLTTMQDLANFLARYTSNLNLDGSPNTAGLEAVLP
jgi:hypothetical protein